MRPSPIPALRRAAHHRGHKEDFHESTNGQAALAGDRTGQQRSAALRSPAAELDRRSRLLPRRAPRLPARVRDRGLARGGSGDTPAAAGERATELKAAVDSHATSCLYELVDALNQEPTLEDWAV